MALTRSPRLSTVVVTGVLGLLACGASLALAGPTPKPPTDPLDVLPAGTSVIFDNRCAQDLTSAVTPSTTVDTVSTVAPTACWRIALVRTDNDTANDGADHLAQYFKGKGFEFTGPTTGGIRSYLGTFNMCGTVMAIDTGVLAASGPPGSRSSQPPEADPSAALPPGGMPTDLGQLAPGEQVGIPVAPGATPDPAAAPTVPGEGVTTVPVPGPTTPSGGPSSPEQALASDPYSLPLFLTTEGKPGYLVVAVQQTRSVVPNAINGRC